MDVSFNASDVAEADDDFAPTPAGKDTVEVSEAEVRENNAGTGEYLKLTLAVTEGDYKGRQVWDYLTYRHETSPTAVEIGERQIAALLRACGLSSIKDTDELVGIPMLVSLKIEKPKAGSDYGPSNRVKTYAPLPAPF